MPYSGISAYSVSRIALPIKSAVPEMRNVGRAFDRLLDQRLVVSLLRKHPRQSLSVPVHTFREQRKVILFFRKATFMSSAAKTATYASVSKSLALASRDRMRVLKEVLHERIAQRAFQYFEQDGQVDGNDLAHWFRAETEILNIKPEIRDSKDSVTLTARVPNADPQDVEICIGEHEAVIRATAEYHSEALNAEEVKSERKELFLLAQWPSEIDPATASASLKDDVLTVLARKASPAPSAVA
jgi:HSP20 family molecular chaperone IbpA